MKPRILSIACFAIALAVSCARAATLYWDGAGTWTGAGNWGTASGGPYTAAWAAGDDAVFNVAGTITGASTLFNSITANENVSMTNGGILSLSNVTDITVAAGKTFNFGLQVLGGNGEIHKLGAGELVFGNATQIYSGGFTMEAGTVTVANTTAFGVGQEGALVMNGGTLQTTGNQDFSGKFSEIIIGGNFGLAGNGGGFIFNADTFLGDATRTINVGNVHTFKGKISSDAGGGIAKDGTGTLVLGGDNDFTGPVIINNGFFSPTHNNALGSTDGDTTINGGGGGAQAEFEPLPPTLTLLRASSGLTIPENIRFASSTAGRSRVLSTNTGIDQVPRNHTLTGSITVTSAQNPVDFESNSTSSITFTGDITGTMTLGSSLRLRGDSANVLNQVTGSLNLTGGDLVKTGSGTWLLGAAGKTYSWNNTWVANGTLKLGLANILPPSGILIMGNTKAGAFGGSTGVFDLNGFDQTVAGITYVGGLDEGVIGWISGTRRITSATPALLTVNNASDFSPTGNTPSTKVILEGAVGLRKEGIGTLTLSGANTNTGLTTVSEGTLALVGGSQASPITVNASAALGFTLGSPTISSNTVDFLADSTVRITGAPDLATNYTLLTTTATISGPIPLLDPPISGFQLQVDGFNTLKLVSTYSTWATDKGLTGAAGFERGKADDPDGDGRNNLQEFAFDGNPLSAVNDGKVVGKIAEVSGEQYFTLTLPVRNGASFDPNGGDQLAGPIDGIYYRIEGSTDLITFADDIEQVTGDDATNLQNGLPIPLTSGWTYRSFRVSGAVPTAPQYFIRANISETP